MVYKVTPKTSNSSNRESTRSHSHSQDHKVADYETALDLAGYGQFSLAALGACVLAFFTTGVENIAMSYVLPAARCELALTTYQVGLVNMAFMCGGTASAFFWGIVGDVFGRRNSICLTLLLNAVITLGQSFFNDYRLLLAARAVNGFLIGGPSTLVFTYLSDLVGEKRRELYLTIVGMSFIAAWLVLPGVAWLVIPFKLTYKTILPIYSWRLYLALSSLPALVGGIWMLFLPESPRFLADTNRSDEALKLLSRIYKWNTNTDKEFQLQARNLDRETVNVTVPFWVRTSKKARASENQNNDLPATSTKKGDKNHNDDIIHEVKKLTVHEISLKAVTSESNRTRDLFFGVLADLRLFVSKQYAFKSSLILFVFFANMAAGFGLNLWIPELLLRMQVRQCPNSLSKVSAEIIAEASAVFNGTLLSLEKMNSTEGQSSLNAEIFEPTFSKPPCDDTISDDIFTSGLIVGACCVLGNAACAILCSRGGGSGVRRAATACTLACAIACASLATSACSCASSNKIAVAAAAALNAASLNGNVLIIRLLLHALPPKLSGLGVCWGAWWGRAGGVASNFAVGILLDLSCPAPFVAVACLLSISIAAILMIKLEEKDAEVVNVKEVENIEKNITLDKYISTHM